MIICITASEHTGHPRVRWELIWGLGPGTRARDVTCPRLNFLHPQLSSPSSTPLVLFCSLSPSPATMASLAADVRYQLRIYTECILNWCFQPQYLAYKNLSRRPTGMSAWVIEVRNLFRIHFESILNIFLGIRRNPGGNFRALLPIQCLQGRRRETVLCAGNIFRIHFESILNPFPDERLYSR